MPVLVIHFARFGPYHHARLQVASEVLQPLGWDVIGLETAGTDATYAWDQTSGSVGGPRLIQAFPGRVHEEISAAECRKTMYPILDQIAPDVVVIAGWASPDALACLSWCRKNDCRRIVLSETREVDGKRVWWKEWIKSYLITRFDGALVGGKSHRDYLVKLGMPADKIRFGYNVVDNAYFATEAAKWRDRKSDHSSTLDSQLSTINQSPYFLASNRFIERKNLSRLIEAYAAYVEGASSSTTYNRQATTDIWNLCLLGDGELKAALIAQCQGHGLQVIESAPWEESGPFNIRNAKSSIVYFPGFRQIEELPRFYAHAGCFVHPALEEPWGLVINEAMACGLPILSSTNVGAVEELVDIGVNGWTFDAENIDEMRICLGIVGKLNDEQRNACGRASLRILNERCPTIAFGDGLAHLVGGEHR